MSTGDRTVSVGMMNDAPDMALVPDGLITALMLSQALVVIIVAW